MNTTFLIGEENEATVSLWHGDTRSLIVCKIPMFDHAGRSISTADRAKIRAELKETFTPPRHDARTSEADQQQATSVTAR